MNAAEQLLATGADGTTALECGDQRMTYAQLREQVRRCAGAWRSRGVEPGDRVFVIAPDSIDWVVAYLGVIWTGGVAVGVNPRLPAAELLPILDDSAPRFVWCEEPVAWPRLVRNDALWQREIAGAPACDAMPRDDEAPALWIGTSGTTGIPKGTIHVQRTVTQANAFACGVLGLGAQDRLYASSKLFFAYALGNSLFAGLRSGATVILDREWPTPERVEEMVARHSPTLLFSVPTLYQKMLGAGVAARLAGRGIRHFVSAGEALPLPTRRGWRDATGLAPVSGYGTTETLCLMLYSDDDSGLLLPTPHTEIEYSHADPAMPQRVWFRHGTVAAGYWNRPEAQRDGFRPGGWFSPGDQFLVHGDGRLEFAGRNDDMLKIAGQWVSTLWVEQSLAGACAGTLQQVAALGVTSREGLAELAVLAVAAPGSREEAARRMATAIEAMPRHRRPRSVHWLESLPLTATGKLQRSRLRALHADMAR
ncbi:benzoate-CoA ligase family protein [Ramlibacter solisilvae]|uniref:4-hydroxybenzoate--CoA ligase n=1 Tax=Ramlibacter tataouinensis TaxID=94132 RepID=A0A127JWJ2_9BURK|nr:AMP-binding protein [Ramlibacter tataouinensis]AMO24281.1 4-hydroxybenzoate--CoA ligase [Ramlibacter tataouinensis]